MTIAGYYLTPEGVVLGADSTASGLTPNGMHFFDFNQKIFEIGTDSSLALMTWGLAGFGGVSIRSLAASLGDRLAATPPASLAEVGDRFVELVSPIYEADSLVQRFRLLAARPPHGTAQPNSRSKDEEGEFLNLRQVLFVGFCIAGYVLPDRTVGVCTVGFDPQNGKPTPHVQQGTEGFSWWGAPNIVQRLVFGADDNLKAALMASGKWTGTSAELEAVCANQRLVHQSLPIREAVDYVHSCIYCTIKAMKFSSFSQICGGPIEIAVITTDRKFRWVRHKPWDAAINDGAL